MKNLEKKLRRQLRELGYCLKVSTAQSGGTPISIGNDLGLYQISDGDHIVAWYEYNLTLKDVEAWINKRLQDDEWLISGGDGE